MFAVQGLVSAALAAAIVAGYWVLYRRAQPRLETLPPQYLTRNPSDLPPAMIGMLFDPAMTPDKLAATLLDLVGRGVIDMTVPGPTADGLRARVQDRRLNLHRDRLGRLRPFEREFVAELFDHIGMGLDELWMSTVRDWWSANPATAGVVEEIVAVRLHQELVAEGLLDPRAGTRKAILTLYSFAVCLGVLLAPLLGVWVMLSFSLAAVLVTWTQRVAGVTPQGAKVAARYESFRRYLADYGRFKDRPAEAVVLWEEYLPMAIVLGVADQAEREMRVGPSPFAGDDAPGFPDEEQALTYLSLRRGQDPTIPAGRIVHGRVASLRFSGAVRPAVSVTGPLGRLSLAARRDPVRALLAVSPFIVLPALLVLAVGLLQALL